jgi:putative PIN family toxin of toxin-antitoxin system
MRCVLDTNLLVSGIIAANAPRRLLRGAMAGEFTLCTSETLLAELLRVLARSRFSARLGSAGLSPDEIVGDLRRIALVVNPIDVPSFIVEDPDDDHVIAAAVAGGADLIATGDRRNLLKLVKASGIPIVTASEAIQRLEQQSR